MNCESHMGMEDTVALSRRSMQSFGIAGVSQHLGIFGEGCME